MTLDVIIPTCWEPDEVVLLVDEIERTDTNDALYKQRWPHSEW